MARAGVALLEGYSAAELTAMEEAGARSVLYAVGGSDDSSCLSSVERYDAAADA